MEKNKKGSLLVRNCQENRAAFIENSPSNHSRFLFINTNRGGCLHMRKKLCYHN